MRTAHIVTTPHEVGDRVLALCGKEHKVKTTWGNIPRDNPICRECVDVAVKALDEADNVITTARRWLRLVKGDVAMIDEALDPEGGLELDDISDAAESYVKELTAQRQQKAESKKAKRTCTCEWDDAETRSYDPDCPVHGHGPDELPPVAPPQED